MNFSAVLFHETQHVVKTSTTGYVPVCHEIGNLFIKAQNFLAFFFICKLKGLYLIVTACDGLSCPCSYSCHIAKMLSEIFCLMLLTSKNQFVHPFLIDTVAIFSRVHGPIHEVCFKNMLCQLPLLSEIFSATKVLYSISSFGSFAIFQCPADLLGTCSRFFIKS